MDRHQDVEVGTLIKVAPPKDSDFVTRAELEELWSYAREASGYTKKLTVAVCFLTVCIICLIFACAFLISDSARNCPRDVDHGAVQGAPGASSGTSAPYSPSDNPSFPGREVQSAEEQGPDPLDPLDPPDLRAPEEGKSVPGIYDKKRTKRSTDNDQTQNVQVDDHTDTKDGIVDAPKESDENDLSITGGNNRMSLLNQQRKVLRSTVVVEDEIKIRHKRSKQGKRRGRRGKRGNGKRKRQRRNTDAPPNTTEETAPAHVPVVPLQPAVTQVTQAAQEPVTQASQEPVTQAAQVPVAQPAPVPAQQFPQAARAQVPVQQVLPAPASSSTRVYHLEAKDIHNPPSPLQTLNTTWCVDCRVLNHGYLDRHGRFKPKDKLYKSWRVDTNVSDPEIAQYTESDGQLELMKTGLYWVYARLTFLNSLQYSAASININGEMKMSCFEHGPAQARNGTSPFGNAQFSTCSMAQPMFLRDRQRLTFTSLHDNTWLYFYPHTAHWGVMLLKEMDGPMSENHPVAQPSTAAPSAVPAQAPAAG